MSPGMDQEPDRGDEPLEPPTRAEEEGDAWEHWHQRATSLETVVRDIMAQAERDLKSAHAEICKLQGLDPATHNWPDWTPQANTLRWFGEIRKRFGI